LELIVHDSLVTAVFSQPLRHRWVTSTIDVRLVSDQAIAPIAEGAFALVPSPACTLLTDSHAIVPDIAVIAGETGAIAMRSPVRPDEISDARVLLYETSATAEVLARSLMWPYFGIAVREWVYEPGDDIAISIVDDALALQDPEAGYSEDLVRSWFVMTGLPVVSQVLLAPRNANSEAVEEVVSLLTTCRETAHERRRELRQLMDRAYGIQRERLVNMIAHQRYSLEHADKDALVSLLVKGSGGSNYHPLTRLPFYDASAQTDP
jgi:predicted solute-binding protein